MIIHQKGDVFDCYAQALAHGCNCQGVMGAGIALKFKERYLGMYQSYRRLCENGKFSLGAVLLWESGRQLPVIFNLATQEYPGKPASLDAIRTAMIKMRTMADRKAIFSIAMPRIGTGYGRLKWEDVEKVISSVFADWHGIVYVYGLEEEE